MGEIEGLDYESCFVVTLTCEWAPPGGPSPEVEKYRRRIREITGEDPKVTNPEFIFDDPPADNGRRNGP